MRTWRNDWVWRVGQIGLLVFLLGTESPVLAPHVPQAPGQASSSLTEEECRLGFVWLFSGADLDQWEHNGPPGSFQVQDGLIVGQRRPGTAYWLSTRAEFDDFELRLDYMLEPRGNSGIFIRAPRQGRTSRRGMEVQLIDDAHYCDNPGVGNTGAIYGVVPPRQIASRPAGQWNDLRITCQGSLVRVLLNGVLVNDVDMNQYPELRLRPRKGYIGLSAHTGVVKFRNVRVRVLKTEPS
jgi:hypothetical protein